MMLFNTRYARLVATGKKNCFNETEIAQIDFYFEPKLDGLAIELVYHEGILSVGATRGDGYVGKM